MEALACFMSFTGGFDSLLVGKRARHRDLSGGYSSCFICSMVMALVCLMGFQTDLR